MNPETDFEIFQVGGLSDLSHHHRSHLLLLSLRNIRSLHQLLLHMHLLLLLHLLCQLRRMDHRCRDIHVTIIDARFLDERLEKCNLAGERYKTRGCNTKDGGASG